MSDAHPSTVESLPRAAALAHPWMPTSPCGSGCLPRPGTVDKAGPHRVALRLSRVLVMLLAGVVLGLSIPAMRVGMRQRLIRAWFRGLLDAFGVRYVVRGDENLAGDGGLFVSNHVSWLDIVVLQAVHPMRLLAKTEVRSWPVIGQLAGRAGTLYIDRDRLTALPAAVRTIADALRDGAAVGAFPEGTTWCGRVSGRYRPAVFQAAVDAGAPVRPVAVRFRTGDGRPTTVAAFVGDATLISSAFAVLRTRELVIEVAVQPVLDAARIGDRRELARRAQAATAAATTSATPVPGGTSRRRLRWGVRISRRSARLRERAVA